MQPPEFLAIVHLVGNEMAAAVQHGGAWADYMASLVALSESHPKRVAVFPYAIDSGAMAGAKLGALLRTPQRIAAGPCEPGDTPRAMHCRELALSLGRLKTSGAL